MKKNFTKSKLLIMALSSLLLVSCGGGGGGGGGGGSSPSNLPHTNSGNPTGVPGTYKPTTPQTPPKSGYTDSTSTGVDVIKNTVSTELQLKERVLKDRDNAPGNIPTDKVEKKGSSAKIAILDSDFLLDKNTLENKYTGINILPSTKNAADRITSKTDPSGKEYGGIEHGEEILSIIREETKLQPIVSSIGTIGDVDDKDKPGHKKKAVIVSNTSKDYDAIFNAFGDQNVKVINQSFGTDEDYRTKEYTKEDILATVFKGEKVFMIPYYKDKVQNKGAIFVWAAGNEKGKVSSLEAAGPYFDQDLERGWISVVGVQERERILKKIVDAHGDSKTEATFGNKYNILGSGEEELSTAGKEASYWSISAADHYFVDDSKENYDNGSSYAAPRVSKTAALVAEKFDWMTNDQVRHTLFTTTDKMELDKDPNTLSEKDRRRVEIYPDDKYGWGMLNEKRALKGPGAFMQTSSKLLVKDSEGKFVNTSVFRANIPEDTRSFFENNIWGPGELEKSGKGVLALTGNNSYWKTTVKEGEVDIYQVHANEIKVEKDGSLVLFPKAIVGYEAFSTDIIDKVEASKITMSGTKIDNYGTLKLNGATAIIGGDYVGHKGSTIEGDINSGVKVLGKIQIEKADVSLKSNGYSSSTPKKIVLMDGLTAEGDIENTDINGMRKAVASLEDGNLVADVSRMSAKEYIGENADESAKNVAENVDRVFDDLDKELKSGNTSTKKLMAAGTLQSMSTTQFTQATQLMSGEIYASAQALTFAQSQNINRDLSNRLAGIDNLKLADGETQAWFSAIGSNGKLQRDGYANAKTHVYGGQFGMDRKFSPTTDLGIALAYSTGKADFDRYAGESKSNMVGLSLYGKKDLPYNFYTAGRLGFATISTKVERELLDANGDTVKGKINHHDKMLSAYIELGKKIGFITPFVGYSQDYLRRGSFNESNAEWGIKADAKNYSTSNFLLGTRAEYIADKYRLSAYVTHSINVNGRDLAFEGTYSGNDTKQKFYGIKQAKNTTWTGVGIFGQITPVVGAYGNVDVRLENGRKADTVFSTGLQFKF